MESEPFKVILKNPIERVTKSVNLGAKQIELVTENSNSKTNTHEVAIQLLASSKLIYIHLICEQSNSFNGQFINYHNILINPSATEIS